jgi:hypothetical protein
LCRCFLLLLHLPPLLPHPGVLLPLLRQVDHLPLVLLLPLLEDLPLPLVEVEEAQEVRSFWPQVLIFESTESWM